MRKITFLFTCLLLIVSHSATTKADEGLVELAKKVRPAVVLIETFDKDNNPVGQGSGFFINDKGHLITNHHVIEGADSATVKITSGEIYLVQGIIAVDENSDVVKLQVNTKSAKTSFLPVSEKIPSVGEDIVVVGNPFGLESTVSKGIVSAIRPIPNFGNIIQISAPISAGSSGSPVLNVKGEVIGVATFILIEGQALNFAVPSKKIIDLETYETIQQFSQYLQILKKKRSDEAKKQLTAAQKEILQKAEAGDSNAMCELGEMYHRGTWGFERDYTKAIEWYLKSAEAGNSAAMLGLAEMYGEGTGVTENWAKAIEWTEKAVGAGNIDAMLDLGRAYLFGKVVPKNVAKALELLRRAAEAGSDVAMLELGTIYYRGEEVKQNCTKAFEWVSKAADKGDDRSAKFFLALLYHEGCGVARDDAKALEWIRKARPRPSESMVLLFFLEYLREPELVSRDNVVDLCVMAANAGDSGAMLWLGNHFELYAKDIRKALEWYQKGAAAGDATCMFCLGEIYKKGVGVEKDYLKSVEWFRKAAEAGHNGGMLELALAYKKGRDYTNAVAWFRKAAKAGNYEAMFYLGRAYSEGEGVAKDVAKAIEWYTKAAEKGEVTSMLNIGSLFLKGEGIAQDHKKAFEWFHKGAEAGSVEAMTSLGVMYYEGKGVDEDKVKSVELWRKAAAADNCTAICLLGVAYEYGHGVTKDHWQAVRLYQRAARLGDEDAKKKLVTLGETW